MTEDYATRSKELSASLQKYIVSSEAAFEEMIQEHPGYSPKVVEPLREITKNICLAVEKMGQHETFEEGKKELDIGWPAFLFELEATRKRLSATLGGKKRGAAKSREAEVLRDKVLETRKIVLDVNPALAGSTRSLAKVIARNLGKSVETVRGILKKNMQT